MCDFYFSILNDVKYVTGISLSDDVIPLAKAGLLQAIRNPHQFVLR